MYGVVGWRIRVFRLHSSFGPRLDPVWTVIARGGRVVASRHSLLSSYYSEPERPGWLNAGGFSFEKRRFPGKGGLVSGKVMAQHIAVPTYPLLVV